MSAGLVAMLLVAACGGADSTTDATVPDGAAGAPTPAAEAEPSMPVEVEAEPSMPVEVVDATGRTVRITSAARIIPLDGDLAEIVFALGLGDQVVATDLSATYPAEADAKPEIGYQRALSAEPILALAPTVLLATPIAGPAETIDQLRAVVPVVIIDAPKTLEGPAAKIRAVATALGVPRRGEELARRTQAEIDAATASVPAVSTRPRVAALYLRGERVQIIFGPGSGIHPILTAAGVIDIGAELGVKDIQPITAEAMVRSRPDTLVVTTTGLESIGGVDKLLALPAFSRTPVATTRRVIAFEDQYLYGLGPRTGQMLAELIARIYA
jgi:iron complex transport system substrate-binding protein